MLMTCNLIPRSRRVAVLLQGVLGQEGILLPGEDVNVMPLRQRLCQALGIHLRAGVVAHRVSVNDFEDFQYIIPQDGKIQSF